MERVIVDFSVDYSISLEDMIDDSSFVSQGSGAHCLKEIDCDLFTHPNELDGNTDYLEGTLFSFYHSAHGMHVIPEERIIEEMEREGYRPANVAELLAYCQAALDDNFLEEGCIMAVGQNETEARSTRWPCINLEEKTIFTDLNLYYKHSFLGVR
ncbi:MAG: hypothetical protein ACOYL8_01245 [Patescibacteria group bacterium]